MKFNINSYPGSKNATGLYQFIINNTPSFMKFYELFSGSGIIGRKLYEGSEQGFFTLSDVFPEVIDELNKLVPANNRIECTCHCYKYLLSIIVENHNNRSTMVYLDPPYTKSSRRSNRDIYNVEFSDQAHIEFLNLISCSKVDFNCMISHYPDPLYDKMLSSWHRKEVQVMTRRGIATEVIYMNYDISKLPLHSYDYVGHDFTERQAIKRKQSSTVKKINKLSLHEKLAMLHQIAKHCNQ